MSSTSSTSASLFTNAADGGLHRRARPVRQAAADASGRRRRGEAAVVVVVVAAGVVCVCGTGSRSSSSGRCCCAVVVPAGTSSSGRTRRRLRTSPCNRCSCCCCSCPGSRSCFLNSPSSPCSCCRRAAPHRRRAPTSDQALERRTDLSVQRHDPVDVGVDVPDQRAVAFEGLGGAFLVVAVDLAEEDSGFFFVFFFFSGRVRVEKAAESYQMLFLFLSLSLLPISHHSQIWPILLVLVEELLHAHERLRPGPHGARLGDGVHRFVAGRSGMGGGGGSGGVAVVCSVARARCCCCCCCCCCSRCCSGSGRLCPWHPGPRELHAKNNG